MQRHNSTAKTSLDFKSSKEIVSEYSQNVTYVLTTKKVDTIIKFFLLY